MKTTNSSATTPRTFVTSSVPQRLTATVALALLGSGCGDGSYGGGYGSYDGDDEAAIGTREQPVYNGSTDLSEQGYLKYRTAIVGRCSGTFLDPLTVLTAAHCVTTNGSPYGTLVTPSSISVRNADLNQDAVKARDIQAMADHDVALVFLEEEFFEPNGDPIFTPIDPYPASDYKNENITISGWGSNVRDFKAFPDFGTLRSGRMKVVDDYVASKRIDGEVTLHTARLGWLSSEQNFRHGDSGGPAWGTRTFPRGVFGVAVGMDKNNAWVARAGHVMDWVHQALESDHGFQHELLNFNSSSDLDDSVRYYSPVGDSASWGINGGDLVQYDNVPDTPIIWKRFAGRRFSLVTEIENAEDNDAAGLTFRFVDDDNFYYCEVNDQSNVLRMRRRYQGEETTLAETAWTGDLSEHHVITADSLGDFEYDCAVFEPGGPQLARVTATDMRLPVGFYGLWQNYNVGVRFSYFGYYGSIFSPTYD